MKLSSRSKATGCIIWILYSNILIYSSFYYNWRQQLIQRDAVVASFILAAAVVAVIWMNICKGTESTYTLRLIKAHPGRLIFVVLCGICVSFFYFGKSFLYENTGYWITLGKFHYFLMLSVSVFIYVLLSLSVLDMFKESIKIKTYSSTGLSLRAHYFILFVMQFEILCIYFYGLNPGNMSYDTYNQVSQLKGIIPFNTWHPIGHTLLLGILLKIWDNYAVITIFQIIFFAAVTSSFYITLLKNGIKWQMVYVTAVIMSAIPSIGVNVVTQWKDIPFTVGLLWGTLILFKISFDENYFDRPVHIFEFIFCMLSIALLRFNGIPVFLAVFVFVFAYVIKSRDKIKKRNCFISSAVVITVFFLVNSVVPNKLEAVPNPAGMKLRPVYQGLAALYVCGEENSLSHESRNMIESVCTPEQIKDYYNPYFADTISSNTPQFLVKLSKIKTRNALKMYIEAINSHPGIVLGDKFNLAVTMWSVTNDRFSYNNAYTTAIQQEMADQFGVHRIRNTMTGAVEKLAGDTFSENYLLNTLVWRPGFFLALELILFLYLIILRDKRLSLFIPLVFNAFTVFLTMPAQDYRYLWFIQVIFPFLVLACSVKLPNENAEEK
jgi:hypothetical protein